MEAAQVDARQHGPWNGLWLSMDEKQAHFVLIGVHLFVYCPDMTKTGCKQY
jgi:hypothetical protein